MKPVSSGHSEHPTFPVRLMTYLAVRQQAGQDPLFIRFYHHQADTVDSWGRNHNVEKVQSVSPSFGQHVDHGSVKEVFQKIARRDRLGKPSALCQKSSARHVSRAKRLLQISRCTFRNVANRLLQDGNGMNESVAA